MRTGYATLIRTWLPRARLRTNLHANELRPTNQDPRAMGGAGASSSGAECKRTDLSVAAAPQTWGTANAQHLRFAPSTGARDLRSRSCAPPHAPACAGTAVSPAGTWPSLVASSGGGGDAHPITRSVPASLAPFRWRTSVCGRAAGVPLRKCQLLHPETPYYPFPTGKIPY